MNCITFVSQLLLQFMRKQSPTRLPTKNQRRTGYGYFYLLSRCNSPTPSSGSFYIHILVFPFRPKDTEVKVRIEKENRITQTPGF